jgi:hypothetical protein
MSKAQQVPAEVAKAIGEYLLRERALDLATSHRRRYVNHFGEQPDAKASRAIMHAALCSADAEVGRLHCDLRRRRQRRSQGVSRLAIALAVSALAVHAARPQSAPRARRECPPTSTSGSSGDGASDREPPSTEEARSRPPGRSAARGCAGPRARRDLRHISHALIAALALAPRPMTFEVLEALSANMTPAERCQFEATYLPASLATEAWKQLGGKLSERRTA